MHQRRWIATEARLIKCFVSVNVRRTRDGETRASYFPSRLTRAVMRSLYNKSFRTAACYFTIATFAASTFAYAQDSTAPPPPDNQQQSSTSTGGWRRVDDPPAQDQSAPPSN